MCHCEILLYMHSFTQITDEHTIIVLAASRIATLLSKPILTPPSASASKAKNIYKPTVSVLTHTQCTV